MIEQRTAYDRRKSHGRKTSYPTLDAAEDAAQKVNEPAGTDFLPHRRLPLPVLPGLPYRPPGSHREVRGK